MRCVKRGTRELSLTRLALALALAVLHDLSTLLNTGLDREQLKACVALIEDGVAPEAVVVRTSFLSHHGCRALILPFAGDCQGTAQRSHQAVTHRM